MTIYAKNPNTMAILHAMASMTGKIPEIKIRRPIRTYSGQGSKEKQRRLRQQAKMRQE